MRVSSSIRARAGLLPTSSRQAGPLPGGASDLGVLQQLGELRAPRLLSKRKGPSIHTTTQAVPGNLKFTTRFGAGEAVPCSVIQKAVTATWVGHTSCRTPLHLQTLPHGWGFISWVMDSHTCQLHLTSGQKAQECLRCILGLSLILMQMFHWGKACICNPTILILYRRLVTYLSKECSKLGSSACRCLSDQACKGGRGFDVRLSACVLVYQEKCILSILGVCLEICPGIQVSKMACKGPAV